MKTSNNTVLITGGSAGIGLEIARILSENNNQVIITGRDKDRLQKAAAGLKNVTPIVSDISKAGDVIKLVEKLTADFPALNVVINNAGNAYVYNLSTDTGAFEKAQDEMLTNYLSVIRLNEKLLPALKLQQDASIVNVSSVVAIVPGSLGTYSASKAALHSYSQSLRLALEDSSDLKVFELMPPLVDTEFSKPIGGHNGIPPKEVAKQFFEAFENNEYEIHVGKTADIYKLFLSSPADALNAMNGQRKQLYPQKN